MLSNSSNRSAPSRKHNLEMFCSAVSCGLISSRYRGTPPVTARTLNFSYADARSCCSCQNRLQLGSDSSFSTSRREMRPTKAVLLRMLSSIQEDTEPQSTRINCGFLLKYRSH